MAHGRRWKLWFTRQEDHYKGITAFPRQHCSHTLIEFEVDTARYHTHAKLTEIIAQLRSEINSKTSAATHSAAAGVQNHT
eukprot:2857352-Prymnesium_polylepis.1